jgi:hypothetical protein
MNQFQRASHDAKVSLKAYQNLAGAHQGFEKLLSLGQSNDLILLSSVFCFAVVKYGRPFVGTKTPTGKTRFPMGALKATPGFVATIHEHLLELRNSLIAHDDLDSIEPRVLTLFLSVGDRDLATRIPTSVAASNMCLAFPNTVTAIEGFRDHVAACVGGAKNKLDLDLARIRQAALDNPSEAIDGQRYEKNYGPASPTSGSHYQPPDLMSNEWLETGPPRFAHAHNGFHYETLRVRRDFHGPEKIALPNGEFFEINPSTLDADKT